MTKPQEPQFWLKLVSPLGNNKFCTVWEGPFAESDVQSNINFLSVRLNQQGIPTTIFVEEARIH